MTVYFLKDCTFVHCTYIHSSYILEKETLFFPSVLPHKRWDFIIRKSRVFRNACVFRWTWVFFLPTLLCFSFKKCRPLCRYKFLNRFHQYLHSANFHTCLFLQGKPFPCNFEWEFFSVLSIVKQSLKVSIKEKEERVLVRKNRLQES